MEPFGTEFALYTKEALFEAQNFKLTVQTSYFKEPIAELAINLHKFFHEKELEALGTPQTGSFPNPKEDYRIFVAHVSNAIHKLSLVCGDYHPMTRRGANAIAGLSRTEASRDKAVQGAVVEFGPDKESRGRKRGFTDILDPFSRRYPARERKKARTSI